METNDREIRDYDVVLDAEFGKPGTPERAKAIMLHSSLKAGLDFLVIISFTVAFIDLSKVFESTTAPVFTAKVITKINNNAVILDIFFILLPPRS